MGRIIEEDEILHLNSVITLDGKYNGMTVKDAVCDDHSCIMYMLKRGLYFDDETLEYAGIQKTTKDDWYELDYNGIIVYSTKWPEEKLKHKKVEETVVRHDGERDESFYQA